MRELFYFKKSGNEVYQTYKRTIGRDASGIY